MQRCVLWETGLAALLCLSWPAWAEKLITVQEQDVFTFGAGASQCDVDGSLAANCGWETQPAFTGWTRSGDMSFTSVAQGPMAHSGMFTLVIGPTGGLGCVEQDVPTDPAALYDLSFWLRNAGAPNRFQVSWNREVIYDQTGFPDFPYTASAELPLGDPTVFIGLTPSDGKATNLKFCFFNPPDYFWFDDVDVLAE